MKLITFCTLVGMTICLAEPPVPATSYLPSNQGSYQSSQSSYSSGAGGYGGSADNGNRRPQQEVEKNAAVLRMDQEVNEHGFHYAYETFNGIRAEEAGDASQSVGGYSYKGDNGITYTVTFTAGKEGFRPQGDHIPVPPPIPEEILVALRKNEQDEAAGIFDDGKYRPDVHGGPQNKHKSSSQNLSPDSGYNY